MISHRTLYYKMACVIEQCRIADPVSKQDLIDLLVKRRHLCFIYKRHIRETGKLEEKVAAGAIEKAIDYCIDLGFLDTQCGLTAVGRKASKEKEYPLILGERVTLYLNEFGISLEHIETTICRLLSASPPIPSTGLRLFESSYQTMPLEKLKACLNLLSQCNILEACQRKIYLPVRFDNRTIGYIAQ